jgi:hypothetical protein
MWGMSLIMSLFGFLLFRYDSRLMLLVLCIVIVSIGLFIKNLQIIKSGARRRIASPIIHHRGVMLSHLEIHTKNNIIVSRKHEMEEKRPDRKKTAI